MEKNDLRYEKKKLLSGVLKIKEVSTSTLIMMKEDWLSKMQKGSFHCLEDKISLIEPVLKKGIHLFFRK